MTTADATSYVHTSSADQTCEEKFSGHGCWLQEDPPAGTGTTAASDLYQHLADTRQRCEDIFEAWGQLKDYYGGADVETVLTTMNELVGRAMALEEAGKVVFMAHTAYASTAETRGHDTVKLENDAWAPDFGQRFATMEADNSSLSRDEFEEEYGHDYQEEYVEMVHERVPYATMAEHVVQDIRTARETYSDTINAIDLEDLSELKFEVRNEANDVADDVDELAAWIMESEAFAGLDLSLEDAQRIAEQVFQNGGWAGDYTDAQGRTWVRAADGRMVRAGSMMDPNLNEAILQAMIDDEEISEMTVDVPSHDGEKVLSITIGELYGNRSNAAQEWLKKNRPDLDPKNTAKGFLALGVLISLLQGANSANTQRDIEMQLYPLLNEQELDERWDRNMAVSGINTGASTTVTVISVALAPETLGASVVIGAVVNVITGEIISWIVESVDEELTTATAEEVDEMSDDEFGT